MNSPKDGGSAFPIPQIDRPGAYPAEPGMSLRDWFAGQAMQLWLRTGHLDEASAKRAYEYADAMLKERGRTS